MLSLLHAPTGFSAPALRPTVAPAAVSMRVSEALPFLEAPPQLDGSMAGDIVSNQQRNPTLIFFPRLWPDASPGPARREPGLRRLVCHAVPPCPQGFDPLNLSGMYSLDYLREAEIKHGRICMLAFVGYLTTDGGIWAPGAPHVGSLEAHDVTVKTGHMLLLLFALAIPESLSYVAIAEMMSGQSDRRPGDYGIGWRFCKPGDKITQEKYKLAEITHCRAAMLGFAGMVTQSAKLGMAGLDSGFPYVGGIEYTPSLLS